jgi:hypothetical protein
LSDSTAPISWNRFDESGLIRTEVKDGRKIIRLRDFLVLFKTKNM